MSPRRDDSWDDQHLFGEMVYPAHKRSTGGVMSLCVLSSCARHRVRLTRYCLPSGSLCGEHVSKHLCWTKMRARVCACFPTFNAVQVVCKNQSYNITHNNNNKKNLNNISHCITMMHTWPNLAYRCLRWNTTMSLLSVGRCVRTSVRVIVVPPKLTVR